MERLSYVINSTRTYWRITLPPLFRCIPPEWKSKFIVVISDYKRARIRDICGFECHFTTDHSFGWSAVNEVIRLPQRSKYYFFITDTSKIGDSFFELTNYHEGNDDYEFICAKDGGQDGLGAWNYDFLMAHTEEIKSMLNCDKEKEVASEYLLFGKVNKLGRYRNAEKCKKLGYFDTYETGTKRLHWYYVSVDLIKYKANWGLPERVLVP